MVGRKEQERGGNCLILPKNPSMHTSIQETVWWMDSVQNQESDLESQLCHLPAPWSCAHYLMFLNFQSPPSWIVSMLYQCPGFILKIKLDNGFKEVGTKKSGQNIGSYPSRGWQPWEATGMMCLMLARGHTTASIQVTGSRQASINRLAIQGRVWTARIRAKWSQKKHREGVIDAQVKSKSG